MFCIVPFLVFLLSFLLLLFFFFCFFWGGSFFFFPSLFYGFSSFSPPFSFLFSLELLARFFYLYGQLKPEVAEMVVFQLSLWSDQIGQLNWTEFRGEIQCLLCAGN
ncbi:hypothetical protein ACH5RR_032651 [Cinchona calisaya]|uniref:Secreted protein n=1 Tax=Cinchona calisaya TaxID=153742 RepID=A0ABD2YIN4_9GENT